MGNQGCQGLARRVGAPHLGAPPLPPSPSLLPCDALLATCPLATALEGDISALGYRSWLGAP